MKDAIKEIERLTKYADNLCQRLQSQPPKRHEFRAEAYKEMLRIDLRKTLANINKLKE